MKNKRRLLIGIIALVLIIGAGIKPIESEFVCPDSTARCYEAGSMNNEIYIDNRPLHFNIYGYQYFRIQIFWVIFISERNSDIIAPRETLAGWFKSEFRESKYVPKLKIIKLENEYFKNRYEFAFDEYMHPKVAFEQRPDYFNPFIFRSGPFRGGIN